TLDHVAPLFVGELAEALTAANPLGVVRDEPFDAAPQKADALSLAVEQKSPTDEALLPPAGDRLRRDVEHFAQLVDGMNRLARVFDLHIGRIGHVFDEQAQIVSQLFPLYGHA